MKEFEIIISQCGSYVKVVDSSNKKVIDTLKTNDYEDLNSTLNAAREKIEDYVKNSTTKQ